MSKQTPYYVVTGRCQLIGKFQVINGFMTRQEALDEIDDIKQSADIGYSRLKIVVHPDARNFTVLSIRLITSTLELEYHNAIFNLS